MLCRNGKRTACGTQTTAAGKAECFECTEHHDEGVDIISYNGTDAGGCGVET